MGGLEKERFVLRGGTLRFVFSERFVLRIIHLLWMNVRLCLILKYILPWQTLYRGADVYSESLLSANKLLSK